MDDAPTIEDGPPPGLAEGLFLLFDPHWRGKVFNGGLLLLIPAIGWFITLGYRKALIGRLFRGDEPVLPEWRNQVAGHLWEGLKAAAVIFAQYLPFYLVLVMLLNARGVQAGPEVFTAGLFFLVFPIFTPLAFPFAVISWAWPGGSEVLHLGEAIGLLFGYTAVTFVIPAGFLQVSRTGRYTAAFRYFDSLAFLVRNFRAYLLAWYRSLAMSLCGHLAVPFSPWGVVWCYLGIIYSFNRILADEQARRGELSPASWFARLGGRDAFHLEPLGRGVVLVRRPNVPEQDIAAVMLVGPVFVPLPRVVADLVVPRG